MEKRLSWIDQARGLALLLVVIGHMGIPYLGQYFTTVHLPLFFFLSGVTFSEKRDFKTFFHGKVKRLLIPYFCLGIPLVVNSVITRMIQGVTDPASYLQMCINFLVQRRWCTVWFLTCLFLTSLVFYAIIKCTKGHSGWIFGICLLLGAVGTVYWELGGVALPWNLDACLIAAPFMALGYCSRKTGWLDKERNFSSWILFALSALLYLLCVTVNSFVVREKFDMALCQSGFAPLSLAAILCGIYCVVFFLKRFSLGRILEYLGRNTMVYFAWHQSIALPLILWCYSLFGWFTSDTLVSDAFRSILTVILIFVLLYPFDLLLRKTKLRFAIGK